MMNTSIYTEGFQACADAALSVWDATWGTSAEVVDAANEMHETVLKVFQLPAGMLPQSVLDEMSSSAEDAVLELRSVFPDLFVASDVGDSARLVAEAMHLLDQHLRAHPAPRRTGLRAVQPSQRHLVH